MTKRAIEKIEAQQKSLQEGSAAWVVGEQLKDICRAESASAALIAQDLEMKEMSLTKAEKQIKKYADAHKKGNFAFVSPQVAEGILRKFYGLPAVKMQSSAEETPVPTAPRKRGRIDLTDFL